MANEQYKRRAKTLGAVQIMIGFACIGSGIILALMNHVSEYIGNFASMTLIAGYPFWSGVSFIISGSISISASPTDSYLLYRSSQAMNSVSAIISLIGLGLLGHDVSIKVVLTEDYGAVVLGIGISAILMIFSFLEFFVAFVVFYFVIKSN
ncbi:membrane-spanning 4-domains subfamily A member 12-like [Tupaia chinensis]|uniref:membrane-spanning 4-domains subfamily A member 12-like n=1 Tax=Tupaia chinensis TaxID=246437 RepID=UPI000FFBDBFC|nr:membrane-spanning 4-domains subfamily A member 12-like [Tupaia chinensis]XP_027622211.1 membrane-spanning 4-domains subfamily A member 12-like [Tupaia chinensis]